MRQANVKKIFIVAGELSGDRTAAWYVHKRKSMGTPEYWSGVGGDFLRDAGVMLFESYKKLNVVGVMEIISHLPRILRIMRHIIDHIVTQQIDEVVLVDFPGFNLRLAGKLKKLCPNIKITYVSPPQLWCWGAWRVKKIKALCDDVIVMYPFEVAWYAQRGVSARWLGSPIYDALIPYMQEKREQTPLIALIPGSRYSEIERFLPLVAQVAHRLQEKYPQVKFVMPLAQSLSEEFMQEQLKKVGLNVHLVRGEQEKYMQLRSCCLAITKPGTVTLELALLGVPAIVFFKISWLSFLLGRALIQVKSMALPNLLLGQIIYPECIQNRCTAHEIVQQADSRILSSFFGDKKAYHDIEEKLAQLRVLLN